MKKGRFDASAFFAALDGQRISRKMTWKDVAAATGVSASTLTRMAQGRRPDLDGLAALLLWSGLSADDFIRDGDTPQSEPSTLAMISTYLRADPHLSEEGAIAMEELVKATYERLRKD